MEIDELIEQINGRVTGVHMDFHLPLIGAVMGERTYEKKRKTENLTVTDSCIGCGLCARKCPARSIEMTDNHPVWVNEQCFMCLRCLHHCPKFAIQYGPKTAKHGQYRNPHVKV